MTDRRKTSFRLTIEALNLLKLLAKQNGISMTAILEILIREKAKKENIHNEESD